VKDLPRVPGGLHGPGTEAKSTLPAHTLSRRELFKRVSGGLVLFLYSSELAQAAEQLPSAYLMVGEDGTITVFSAKVEYGQGVMTSLAQMVAEELDVPMQSMAVVAGDTKLCPVDSDGGTYGSLSTQNFGVNALRPAAARARALLVQLASSALNLPIDQLTTQGGFVVSRSDPAVRISYAALAGGKTVSATLAQTPKAKDYTQFTLSGQPVTRLDAIAKVTGRAQYTADIRVPEMLYARLLRPPARGATLKSVDTSAAEQIAGARVVRTGNLIAVLHEHPDMAERAWRLIKAEYNPVATVPNDETIYDYLLSHATSSPRVLGQKGNVQTGEQQATTVREQTYYTPYIAHAPMEPHAAVASVDGSLTIWSSTQTPFTDASALRARLITPYIGGAFGGKISTTQAASEAASLARAVGKPVCVAWTRDEEFLYDNFQCPSIIKIRSGLGPSGQMTFWDNQVYYVDDRGAALFYNVTNHRTRIYNTYADARPFAGGAWRAPGANANTFARESHIDVTAAAAGLDPLEFRLKHLVDTRMRSLLEKAAASFGWSKAKAPSGRGCGLACGMDANTYVAMLAEVAVDQNSGEIKIKRVLVAQDMGRVINPDGARLQMEGGVMMGLGYSLSEEIHFQGSKVSDRNYLTYSIPRFSWMPKIEALLIANDSLGPKGGGEPPVITVGAALANAVFDATGARLNRLPMTPDRVLAAIAQSQNLALDRPERIGDQLRLSWKGGPGVRLQRSSSLSSPAWQDVPSTEGASSVSLPASDANVFFRLVRNPQPASRQP
jgi:nicotinate dehydrogenase subunit B